MRKLGDGEERLDPTETPRATAVEREDGKMDRCCVAVHASGVPNGLVTPNQAEQETVKENFLQRAP